LADMTANSAPRQARAHLDSSNNLCAMRVLNCAPLDLLDHERVELQRDEAEAVRVTYVAATRARDLLVIPAVGDQPYGDKWLASLNAMIYPSEQARRTASSAPGCPRFGRDSVVQRPDGDAARHTTV